MSSKPFIPSINLIESRPLTISNTADWANKDVGVKVIYVVSVQKELFTAAPGWVPSPCVFNLSSHFLQSNCAALLASTYLSVTAQAWKQAPLSDSFSSASRVTVTCGYAGKKSLALQRRSKELMGASAEREDKDGLLIWFMCVVRRVQVRMFFRLHEHSLFYYGLWWQQWEQVQYMAAWQSLTSVWQSSTCVSLRVQFYLAKEFIKTRPLLQPQWKTVGKKKTSLIDSYRGKRVKNLCRYKVWGIKHFLVLPRKLPTVTLRALKCREWDFFWSFRLYAIVSTVIL